VTRDSPEDGPEPGSPGAASEEEPESLDEIRWTLERVETVHETRIFDVTRHWTRAHDGEEADFYILSAPDWVQAVPLLPDGRFVMVEQFRHGTQRITIEFPAGIVEEGESPIDCAIRELEEETGYVAGSAELVGRVDPNAALQDNELFIIVLRDCEPTGHKDEDPRERIRTRIVDPDEVDGLLERGEFRDAYGIIAWDFYRRENR
jgi:8-oxo-dGTP pyrophosphatase MutT (NUDIX family)